MATRTPPGYTRLVQQDFSGGMFPQLAPELIPPNGAYDITNGLLDEQNVVYRRGGTTFASSNAATGAVHMLWTGILKNGGLSTILCTATKSYKLAGGTLSEITLTPPSLVSRGVGLQGRLYMPGGRTWDGATAGTDGRSGAATAYAAVGNRLLAGESARVDVSNIPATEGEALKWTATNYLTIPEGGTIIGMIGWRTVAMVFTTAGIWLIGGLSHAEIVDTSGNVQWSQDRYSADAILWAQAGLAAWKGGLVVPCHDDVWLTTLGVTSEKSAPFRAISGPIRQLYRSYVNSGYAPGGASVFNGHYFLPILNGAEVVDMLVCRLEGVNEAGRADFAWTHLNGSGAKMAATTPTVSPSEGPLLGAGEGTAPKVWKLEYLTPLTAPEKDADEGEVGFSLTTRSIETGNLVPNTIAKARLTYRLTGPSDATKVLLGFANSQFTGPLWGHFNWGQARWGPTVGPFLDLGESTPPATLDPEGAVPKVWRVNRKLRYATMQAKLSGVSARFSIRGFELFVREDGRLI
jgi:hypothetical protein